MGVGEDWGMQRRRRKNKIQGWEKDGRPKTSLSIGWVPNPDRPSPKEIFKLGTGIRGDPIHSSSQIRSPTMRVAKPITLGNKDLGPF